MYNKKITDNTWRSDLEKLIIINDRLITVSSMYLTMRDKVRIAIDIYLPADLGSNEKLPTILHQTRYFRRQKTKLLPKLLKKNNNYKRDIINKFVRNGYAYVNVDVRGSGASYGNRMMEWSPDEVDDGTEIIDWIILQSWSNGSVAGIGMSYTATAVEMLLRNNHPAMKVAVIQYSLFDVFTDIMMPGGVRNESFLSKWSMLNKFRDIGVLPESIPKFKQLIFRQLINGVAPVYKGSIGKKCLKEAEKEHKLNYDIYNVSRYMKFRDDRANTGQTPDLFSPHAFIKDIEKSLTPIYNWSGWYDGAYTRSAVYRFINIKTPGSRLILGPWDHAGKHTADPFIEPDHNTDFKYEDEIICYLNHHLKKDNNELSNEIPVHYFTVGEGKWKSAETWPVPGFNNVQLYFNEKGSLTSKIESISPGMDKYKIDNKSTSGNVSRWISQVNVEKKRIQYKNISEHDKTRLLYLSKPLKEELEITGHPLIDLYIKSDNSDLQLFIYLEEMESNGTVNYVTEGVFRAIHRRVSDEVPIYKTIGPYHSYKREDALPLKKGEIAEISFDMFPISYLFKKNSRIRVSLACADIDNFESIELGSEKIEIIRSDIYPTSIHLPVKVKNILF